MKKTLSIFVSIMFVLNIFTVVFANSIDLIEITELTESIEEIETVDMVDETIDIDDDDEIISDIELSSIDYTDLVEIGRNMPAFAASTTTGHEAFYGNDGNVSTYWQKADTGSSTAERYFVALPKAVPIKAIRYFANAAGEGDNITFYLSNDGEFNKENKVKVGTSVNDSAETEILVNNSTAFKYILLEKYWTSADDYASARTPFTVAELEIYTDDVNAEGIVAKNAINVAKGKTITSSGKYGGLSPDKIVNDNYRDEWATDTSSSTWVMIDLGAEYCVDYIVINSGHVTAKDSPEDHLNWRSGITFKGTNDGDIKSAKAVTLYDKVGPVAENSGLISCDVYDPKPAQSSRRPSPDASVSGTVVFEVDEAVKGQRFRYVGFTAGNRIDLNNMEVYTSDTILDDFTVTNTSSNIEISSKIKGVNQNSLQLISMFNDENGKYLGAEFDSIEGLSIGSAVNSTFIFNKPENANEADVVMFKDFSNKNIIRAFNNATASVVPKEESINVTANTSLSVLTKAEDIIVSGITEDENVMLWVMPYGDSTTIEAPTAQQMLELSDSVNATNFNTKVKQAYLVSSKDGKYSKSFNMTGYPAGWYTVKAVFENDIKAEDTVFAFYFISAEEDASIAAEFEQATSDEIEGLIDKYLASFIGYDAMFDLYGEKLGRYFTIARSAYLDGAFTNESKTIENIANVKEVFDIAYTLAELVSNDEFLSADNFNEKNLPVLIDGEDYDSNEIETIFAILVDDIVDTIDAPEVTDDEVVDAIVFNFEKARALSLIYDGSYKEVEKAITAYKEVLDIDGEDIYDDVSTLAVAKKLGNSLDDIEKYSKGMQDAVEKAIEEAKDVEGSETIIGDKDKNKGNGGRGGGGSRGGSSGATITQPEIKDEPLVESEKFFNDLYGFEWAEKSINTLYEKDVINGTGESKFSPGNTVNREEITKMIVKAFYMDNIIDLTKLGSNGFSDCDIDAWYYPYITIAKSNEVINGVSSTEFGIGQFLTRQDLAVMIKRVMDAKIKEFAGLDEPIIIELPSVDYNTPIDIDNISAYASQSIDYMLETGIITGYEDGTVRPLTPVSRAEAAVILDRVMNILGR